MSDKKAIFLDAAAFKESACTYRLVLIALKGFRQKTNSVEIEFGQAFHKFRSTILNLSGDDKCLFLAIKAAEKYFNETPMLVKQSKIYLNHKFLTRVCIDYWDIYGDKDDFQIIRNPLDNKALVECRFRLPYYEDDQFIVYLVGTIDQIGKKIRGCFAYCDAKTTGAWDTKDYLRSYELSSQMLFYRWILREYAKVYPESFIAEINKHDIGCFIDGVFYRKDTNGAAVIFERSNMIFFTEDQLDELGHLIFAQVDKLINIVRGRTNLHKDGFLNGACNGQFGRCKFFEVCAAPNELAAEAMLKNNFNQVPYEPLKFGE